MRVGILTSWRVPCGIYMYSSRLADALATLPGVQPVILAGRADEHRSVPEESPHEVHDVAKIGLWRDDGVYSLPTNAIVGTGDTPICGWLDALHVQYQSMLFNQEALAELSHLYRTYNGGSHRIPLAVTFHDNCQAPSFPYGAFDLKFTHRWNVGPADAEVIPFGIEDRPPVVRTFGLGRSQVEVIQPLCERNGWVFESATSHEPIHGGGQAWRTHEDLIAWLRGADAIVLWYPPQPMAGSSQAARTAMASRRPVFTNSTEWFEDLPREAAGITKCAHEAEMEDRLRALFHRPYVQSNSWVKVAQKLVERYRAAPTARPQPTGV